MSTITAKYNTSVMVDAGWRSVEIEAVCKKISEKRAQVIEVISIDDEDPHKNMTRTGANRQRYNGLSIAKREVGAVKILSRVIEWNDID